MELQDNPLLKPEDYLAQYRDSVDKLKNNPELISFDKLCYEIFAMTELGKKFMEIVEERFLIPSMVNRENPNYPNMVIWADGFKDFPRMIKQHIRSHDQRIKAEGHK